jgi:hypothetical protein
LADKKRYSTEYAMLYILEYLIYFIVASQEYSDLVEFLQVGIQGETQERQVEMALFIGAGIICLDS